jgi:hypothetical protein
VDGHDTTVMGVALIVVCPLKPDIWGTLRSVLVSSRVKQSFQLPRHSTRDVTTVQQWTHILCIRQCLLNIYSTRYIDE